MQVSHETSADGFNAILNHPDVRPLVGKPDLGALDLSMQVTNPRNYLLMGEHGGILFVWLQPGIYERHIAVLPVGRGEWRREFMRACNSWLFTHTDAFEITSFIPVDHEAMLKAAEGVGSRREFVVPKATWFRDGMSDVQVMGYRIQDWLLDADYLVAVGERALEAVGTSALFSYNGRATGALVEMIAGGQRVKALAMYNRFAAIARQPLAVVVSHTPLTLRFGGLEVIFADDGSVSPARRAA